MAKATVRIEGMERTLAAFRKAPDVMRVRASEAVTVSTFVVGQRARANAPVNRGMLRSAIEAKTTGLNGRVVIGPEAYYWRFIEFGTVHMAARPFVRPAAETESDGFVQRMREVGPKVERDLSVGRFL